MHHKKVLLISRTTRLHDRMRELSHELDISVLLATPDTFDQAITSTADFGLVALDLAGVSNDLASRVSAYSAENGSSPSCS